MQKKLRLKAKLKQQTLKQQTLNSRQQIQHCRRGRGVKRCLDSTEDENIAASPLKV